MRRLLRTCGGFSMIEVLIVLAILGVVTAQMWLVFSTQKRVYLTNERALDVQESARLIIDLIAHDARMAGFMVPAALGISSGDGGGAGPDRLCLSDPDYFFVPLDGSPSPEMDNKGNKFSGGQVTNSPTANALFAVGDLDIDGDGTLDFLGASSAGAGDGGGIILSDGTRTWCSQIDTIVGTQVNLVHTAPGGLFAAAIEGVPAVIYEIQPGTATLTRNGMTLSTVVEDMQLEYWVDSQIPDDQIGGNEFPIFDLNVNPGGWVIQLDRIRRVQISIVTRSDRGDGQQGVQFNRHRRPAVANRGPGPRDDRARTRFTANVLPRNML